MLSEYFKILKFLATQDRCCWISDKYQNSFVFSSLKHILQWG